jgi:hypothetical protein
VRSGRHLRSRSLARHCGRAGGNAWDAGSIVGRGEEGRRLSALFRASMACRRLGVEPGGCSCPDFLAGSFELAGEENAVAALLVVFRGRVEAERPSCRVCRVSKVGLERFGEGDRR